MTQNNPLNSSQSLLRRLPGLVLLIALSGCMDPDEPGNLVPKTVTEDPSLPQIFVNGTHLHAESYGNPDDPMLMVLHGGPGADYRSLLPLEALAEDGFHVVFWDQRGSGLSERHDADIYTFDLLMEDLEEVIAHYTSPNQEQLVFVGHSWGAMYATWFINEHGDYGGRLKGAVLSEPGAFTKAQLDAYMDRLIGSIEITGEQLTDMAWLSQFMSPVGHERADYIAKIQTGPTPAEHIVSFPEWRFGAVVQKALFDLVEEEGFDWTTRLDEFEPEVFFLRSELNESMPLWHQQELAANYPNARIETISGVGHELIWERPDEYLKHARAYLRSIDFDRGAQ